MGVVNRSSHKRNYSLKNKEKEVLVTIKKRKLQYLGHIIRNENTFHLLQKILPETPVNLLQNARLY